MFKNILLGVALTAMSISVTKAQKKPAFVPFINSQHAWVDSVFNSLTPKERVGQLFLVRAHTNLGDAYTDSVKQVIQKEQLGGLVVFQGGPVRHADMLNKYQSVSKVPLLVTYDGEWGLGMRLPDSTISYPYQMTLGAVQNEALLYDMGVEVAKDFLRIGMHFNFAPVVDINNNPLNPVIGVRSFGDNKYNVTSKAKAYMNGMVDGGIITSLKHFPGHGDTETDSHHDLPQLPFSKERLDSLEMYPFKEMIKSGTPAIMVAHMNIPSLDPTPNMPSSISKPIVTGILREELGYRGLIVTDAMDMKGAKKFFPNGEADVRAIIAGHDLLEISENSARAIDLIVKAIADGRIQQSDLDMRVKKVLASKYWLGLNNYKPVAIPNLVNELNRPESKQLLARLSDASVTLLNSNAKLKSFKKNAKTTIISIGIPAAQQFEKELTAELAQVTQVFLPDTASEASIKAALKAIKGAKQVILAIHDNRLRPKPTLTLNEGVRAVVAKLAKKSTVVMMTNAYALADVAGLSKSKSILLTYQNDSFMQSAAVRALTGQIKTSGKLPVTINKSYKFGDGK